MCSSLSEQEHAENNSGRSTNPSETARARIHRVTDDEWLTGIANWYPVSEIERQPVERCDPANIELSVKTVYQHITFD